MDRFPTSFLPYPNMIGGAKSEVGELQYISFKI